MSLITILGASGFIGSNLVAELQRRQAEYLALRRDDQIPQQNLGDVIYCIGVTADFRSKPFETVDAHVCKLRDLLKDGLFESLTYLSSTRVYANNVSLAREEDPISVAPANASDLYNISKAMGESLALNCGRNARVVRLANVYGADIRSENFLDTIIKDAITTGKITINTSANSVKDYVSIADVVPALIEIAKRGRERIYNLASGISVSNGELAAGLSKATSCEVKFLENAAQVTFPPIAIDRLRTEFEFKPARVLDDLNGLVSVYRETIREWE
ncbi:MAG TPA: SDR family oxidoreductase [Pyrinomonadaceae bacterium]|nr:SDR family oxidoreductase [Pyrinomonadaceae bacterium]